MAEFVDESDVRRPSQVPRISQRYTASTNVVWYPPSQRRLVRGRPIAATAQLLDLSVAGALLKGPQNRRLQIGSRVKFEMNGTSGIVEVRNMRPAGEDTYFYGISFFSMSEEFKAEIFEIVARVRSEDFDQVWRRPR